MVRKRKKKKSLWCRTYATGYRFVNNDILSKKDTSVPFSLIMPSKKYGYADPFPFIYKGEHYIFVEITDKFTERGSIGVYCIEDKRSVVEIIRETFHMSYPNVFEWNNHIYMIPETYEANEIRLYIAEEFPYKWKLDKVLKTNLSVVDFSYMIKENELFGVAFDIGTSEWKSRFFKLDLGSKEMAEIYPVKKGFIDKRPGGNFYFDGSKWILPVQECAKCYGEYLHLLKTDVFNEKEIVQEEIRQLKATDIRTKEKIFFDRIHTYNRVANLETIDLFIYQLSLKKIWLLIRRKI